MFYSKKRNFLLQTCKTYLNKSKCRPQGCKVCQVLKKRLIFLILAM